MPRWDYTTKVAQTSVCGVPLDLGWREQPGHVGGNPQTEVCATRATESAEEERAANVPARRVRRALPRHPAEGTAQSQWTELRNRPSRTRPAPFPQNPPAGFA